MDTPTGEQAFSSHCGMKNWTTDCHSPPSDPYHQLIFHTTSSQLCSLHAMPPPSTSGNPTSKQNIDSRPAYALEKCVFCHEGHPVSVCLHMLTSVLAEFKGRGVTVTSYSSQLYRLLCNPLSTRPH